MEHLDAFPLPQHKYNSLTTMCVIMKWPSSSAAPAVCAQLVGSSSCHANLAPLPAGSSLLCPEPNQALPSFSQALHGIRPFSIVTGDAASNSLSLCTLRGRTEALNWQSTLSLLANACRTSGMAGCSTSSCPGFTGCPNGAVSPITAHQNFQQACL